MTEQVIAAELHRSTNGTVDRIVFNGDTYVRRNTVPPPNLNLAGYVGDWSDDYVAEARKNVDAAVAHSREVAPLPPELLTPDPDLMASPEGDVKGLRELQDAARQAQQCQELGRQGQQCVGHIGHTGNHSGAFMVVNGADGQPLSATRLLGQEEA